MSDPYSYYFDCLAGKGTMHPDLPCAGRWRISASRVNQTGNVNKSAPRSRAVAIWPHSDGKLRVRVDSFQPMTEDDDKYLQFVDAGWPRCKAVSVEEYDDAVAGKGWPDEAEVVTRLNNQPPDENSIEALTEAVDDLAREAKRMIAAGAATAQEVCDQAADISNKLSELQKKADKARETEKAPHLKASRDVDAKWKPVITLADIYRQLKSVTINPWLDKKRREAEELRFQAQLTGTKDEELPAAKAQAGTRGRPVSQRQVKYAVVENYDTLLAALAKHEEVVALVSTLADQSAKSGIALPGMKIETKWVAA